MGYTDNNNDFDMNEDWTLAHFSILEDWEEDKGK